MPLGSYHVGSHSKYISPPPFVRVAAKKIAPEDIKSMTNEIPMSPSSYPYGLSSMTIMHGSAYWKTSSTLTGFPLKDIVKDGLATTWDESGQRMYGWKSAGEDVSPNMFDAIPKMPNFAYIEGITDLGMFLPNPKDTQVNLHTTPRIVEAVDPNKIGYSVSKAGNLKEDELRRNLLFDDTNRFHYDISRWVEFLAEKGFTYDKAGTAGILGLGVEDGNFVAAYYPNRGYLVVPPNFHDVAKRIMYRHGLSEPEAIDAMKRFALLHEIAHVVGVESEELQGLLAAEFYSKATKSLKGTRWELIYKALAQEGNAYAKSHSKAWLNDLFELPSKSSSISDLVKNFEKEAKAYGLEGKEATEYVEKRIANTYGALLGKSVPKSHRKQNLEDLVEKEFADEGVSYKNNKHEKSKEIDKSEYKSMNDVKEREKSEAKEAQSEEASD